MANSVHQDRQGPDWPLGIISIPTPGTPVNIMSLVDSTNVDAPQTATPGTAGADEYTSRAQQIIFQAVKSVGPVVDNTGPIYVVRKGQGAGLGNRTDAGAIVAIIQPGQTFLLSSAPLNRNVFNGYRYYLDADTASDACLVTMIVG